MRMSTKGRFAVNSMIDLALREGSGPVALAAIASRQQISLSYLEQLFSRLRRAGLVNSTRGPGGGYTLGRDLSAISVADVVLAVEEPSDYEAESTRRGPELTGALWDQLNEVMLRHLATVPLKTLVDEQIQQGFVAEAKPARRPLAPPPAIRPVRTTAPNSVFAFGQSFSR
jgi:Rrf2 family iron-sulfur cluster assembly transcriptional regulator